METSPNSTPSIDYGQDAHGIMRGFLLGGVAGVALAGLCLGWAGNFWLRALAGLGLAAALIVTLLGVAMLAYGRVGKYRVGRLLMGRIAWRGDEQVLDIGTGRGFLLAAAAHRLTSGHATGIDIWQRKDLSGNSPLEAERNLALEGVAARATLLPGDARQLPFGKASFDVVLSLLCIHNIEEEGGRQQACAEIARVLKPGGTVLLGEYMPMGDYSNWLRAAGLEIVRYGPEFGAALSLMWVLEARKPALQP